MAALLPMPGTRYAPTAHTPRASTRQKDGKPPELISNTEMCIICYCMTHNNVMSCKGKLDLNGFNFGYV